MGGLALAPASGSENMWRRCRLCRRRSPHPWNRVGAAAQNALEVARFGGLATDDEPSPYEVDRRGARVPPASLLPGRRTNEGAPRGLLVPPLMLAADIYDVSRPSSAVSDPARARDRSVGDRLRRARARAGRARAHAGRPCARGLRGGRPRQRQTGRDVHLAGTRRAACSVYQVAAYRRNDGLASLITFGSPVDTRPGAPFGIPGQVAGEVAEVIDAPVPRRRRPGVVQPQRLPAARSGQVARATGSSSCSSSTTARRCSRASVSAGSSRPRAGWRGPGRRSRSS